MKRKPVKGEFRISPLTIPLKTTKKGAAAPFLGFSPEFGSYRGFLSLQNAKQMRIYESGEVIEILCGCFGCILYGSPFMRDILRSPCKEEAYRIPYVKYSTGTDKRFALCIVRLGNPIRQPPEGRLDYGRRNDNTHNVTTSFFCASALFRPQRSFLPYLFCQDRKDMARGATARRIEEHRTIGASECRKKPPLRAAFPFTIS